MTYLTDPHDMPEDERMTPAELRVVREFLGLPVAWLAQHLQVSEKTVANWESGRYTIPDGVRVEVERIEEATARFVDTVVQRLLDLPEPTAITYRTDAEHRAADPGTTYPASWHRAVVARVALEVPGLGITYA